MTFAVLTALAPFLGLPWPGTRQPSRTAARVARPQAGANAGTPAHPSLRRAPTARPVRVVRVAEPGERRHAAGRMVISGRMADVCRELERLARDERRGA